jgi:hypothetical protein
MEDKKYIMAPPGGGRTDNESIRSVFASHGVSKSLQADVNRIIRSFPVKPTPENYDLTPFIKTLIVKWVLDYFYGSKDFPYLYAPNIARSLECTAEEKAINKVYDEKLVAHIQSSGCFANIQKPSKSVSGEGVNWSVFPRFYIVPNGYPTNNIEEKFARLVGWQLACFQQRATTLNFFYAKRLNEVSGEWFFPEYINVGLNSWNDRSLYMNDCYAMLQQAEDLCESIIEEYLLKFAREANVFVNNVQNNICETDDLFEDYKNMQINNAICNTYGLLRKISTESAKEFQHLKSSMLLAGDTASASLLQAAFNNKKRCIEIDWKNAFNWLGIPISQSLSISTGCGATKGQQIGRAANDPGSTRTLPPFSHMFFGKHKVHDFTAGG